MKLLYVISFFLFTPIVYSQADLTSIDTTIDYSARFYQNGKLITPNSLIELDSNNRKSYRAESDTLLAEMVKSGRWIEYFDRKKEPSNEKHYKYYRLCEYYYGVLIGKSYYFKKDGTLIQTIQAYPKLNDTIFNGTVTITYDKGKIAWVEYKLFRETASNLIYLNITSFYPNGNKKYFSFLDEYHSKTYWSHYSKNGLSKLEIRNGKSGSFQG